MKYIFYLFFYFLFTFSSYAQENAILLTNYMFEDAHEFSEGLAAVEKNGKYGFIDKFGNVIIDFQFDYAFNMEFSEGLAGVGKNGLWGFIDKTGKVIIDYQFDNINDPAFKGNIFKDGLAHVRKNNKSAFIDKSGNVVIDYRSYAPGIFSEGLCSVFKEGKYGYIDKTGKLVIDYQFNFAHEFSEGLAVVHKNGNNCFINKKGEVVIDLQCQGAWSFSEGLAAVRKNDKYGFIDKSGNLVIDYQFDYAHYPFSEGLALVSRNDKYGFVDKMGNLIIDYQFSYAFSFSEGLAAVKKNGQYGFIDKFGNLIVDYQFDNVWSKVFSGLAVVEKNNKYDFIKLPTLNIVDLDIPKGQKVNTKTFALIIGNEYYNNEINVEYAHNDARVFSQYCIKTLGIPENQVHLILDASYGQILGELSWLTNIIEVFNGDAKIILYYAGHGMLDESSKNAFILPVDGNSSISETGISLDNIYKRFSLKPTKSVSVFLDACFSGATRNGMLLTGRGVRIQPKENIVKGNLIVFSATDGAQTALPYEDKEHGLFTYYLLKKLNESKGQVTYGELSEYLIQNVKQQSIMINQKLQTPKINIGASMGDQWENIQF